MLIVSRKPGETIVVGKDQEIVFEILEVSGKKVRVGIRANSDIPVHRGEVAAKIKLQQEQDQAKK